MNECCASTNDNYISYNTKILEAYTWSSPYPQWQSLN
jgi:hypothetical protein